MTASVFLIEAELCRIHIRFDHSSMNKLYTLLTRTNHDVEHKAIKMINKFCHYC